MKQMKRTKVHEQIKTSKMFMKKKVQIAKKLCPVLFGSWILKSRSRFTICDLLIRSLRCINKEYLDIIVLCFILFYSLSVWTNNKCLLLHLKNQMCAFDHKHTFNCGPAYLCRNHWAACLSLYTLQLILGRVGGRMFFEVSTNVRFILNMTIKIDKNDDVIQFLRTSSEFSRPENNV